jgi:hypothetical protein
MRFILLILVAAAFVGCATPAKQTEDFFKSSSHLPPTQLIDHVPFINQESGQCGPATLAMAMNWAGHPVTVEQILPQVYNPKMKGSLQTDMLSASRRNGLIAIPIEGLPSLLTEVAAGHPVIVFENLAFTWLPQWHYAVVIGYDLPSRKVIMHSGPEAFKNWDMEVFERSWMLGDYWGLLVLPPDQLSVTADELAHVRAASALEQAGQLEAAEISYKKILTKWPQSLSALIGIANMAFEKKDYVTAIQFLKSATRFHPESAYAWHNLAIAQGTAHMRKQASLSAKKAMKLVSLENKKNFSENLSEWIKSED